MLSTRKVYSSSSFFWLFSRRPLIATLTTLSRFLYTGYSTPTPAPTPQLSRMASTLPRLPIFQAISSHDPKSTVIVHSASGRRFTYGELLRDVADAKEKLLFESGGASMNGQRIAFLVENSYDYVGAQPSV